MKGFALWITGLPGSGKSSIAYEVIKKKKDIRILRLDEIRKFVTPRPTYTEEERNIVYRSLVYMAKLLTDEGLNVIIDATGNRRIWREEARQLIDNFAEVYVRCPLEICIQREIIRDDKISPKDIYTKKIREGKVPGINVPYEEPINPDLILESDKLSIEESAEKILAFIKERFKK
ncbi:MAG: adenylyl-sulfate kinase [Candidatus Hydrothermarchaeota archaeon]